MKIILIGFMGSGKTTLAKQLANSLGYELRDMDAMIEEAEKCSISSLFEIKGEAYFRKIEADLLLSLSSQDKIVVATGGGTPCNEANSNLISSSFVSVFLDVEKDLLLKRVKREYLHRPLLASSNDIEKKLDSLLTVRKPFYERATHTIYVNEKNQSNLLQLVLETINYE